MNYFLTSVVHVNLLIENREGKGNDNDLIGVGLAQMTELCPASEESFRWFCVIFMEMLNSETE